MTDSPENIVAIILGLGVFLVVVAVGWRSVQNRRIVRLQGTDGQETIIVAGEDDVVSSVQTTTQATQPEPGAEPSVTVVDTNAADPAPAPRTADKRGTAI